jgi:hypothetical protein
MMNDLFITSIGIAPNPEDISIIKLKLKPVNLLGAILFEHTAYFRRIKTYYGVNTFER